MPRHTTKPPVRSDWWEGETYVPALGHPQVFQPEPIDTGLLDERGRRLVRKMGEVGFCEKDRPKER